MMRMDGSIRQRVVIFFEIFWIPTTTIRWMTTRGVFVDAMGDGARGRWCARARGDGARRRETDVGGTREAGRARRLGAREISANARGREGED
jgi:hypothetical protein|tara:strand:+ start:240 stop:515 length:276 start_codon:yes stop_codon:yes gene_type:complete